MNEQYVDTMQTTPCECRSFSNGFSTGVGIAVGVGAVTAATVGIYTLLKKR